MKKIILLFLLSFTFSVAIANNEKPTLVMEISCNDSIQGLKAFNAYIASKDLCMAFDIRLVHSIENEIKIYHKDSNILLATIFGGLPSVEWLSILYKEQFNPTMVEDIVSKMRLMALNKDN